MFTNTVLHKQLIYSIQNATKWYQQYILLQSIDYAIDHVATNRQNNSKCTQPNGCQITSFSQAPPIDRSAEGLQHSADHVQRQRHHRVGQIRVHQPPVHALQTPLACRRSSSSTMPVSMCSIVAIVLRLLLLHRVVLPTLPQSVDGVIEKLNVKPGFRRISEN